MNRVNSSNFNYTVVKFPHKFDDLFSHVFIFRNMFPESHGFIAMPVQAVSKIHAPIINPYIIIISEGRRNCSTL